MRLAQPIEFDAVDDLPVDLVFMLLSPVDAGAAGLVMREHRHVAFVADEFGQLVRRDLGLTHPDEVIIPIE